MLSVPVLVSAPVEVRVVPEATLNSVNPLAVAEFVRLLTFCVAPMLTFEKTPSAAEILSDPEPSVPPPTVANVPPLTVVPPLYVFRPVSVNVPPPTLFRANVPVVLAVVSEMTP